MMKIPKSLENSACGILDCIDRLVLTVIPQGIEYPQAYINHLRDIGVDPMKHTEWASQYRTQLDSYLKAIAAGRKIEILDGNHIRRKDDVVKKMLSDSGNRLGLICIIRDMERCRTFYYAKTKKFRGLPIYFKSNKCIFYYVYVHHAELGIVQIRVQTYAPFYCQIIVNGHRILERLLIKNGIKHQTRDNSFEFIANLECAQKLSDSITGTMIESVTKPLVYQYFPFLKSIGLPLRYTIRQVEYSSDIIANMRASFHDFMPDIIGRMSLHEPEEISRFMVKQHRRNSKVEFKKYETEFGSCIRFTTHDLSLKLYDKGKHIIRIETTCTDIHSLRGYRTISHKNGRKSKGIAPLSKHISSLSIFINRARQINHRFIDHLGTILRETYSIRRLDAVTEKRYVKGKSVRGFSFFDAKDRSIIQCAVNPTAEIHGFIRKDLMARNPGLSESSASYAIRRMRIHGLIKKVAGTRRYYPTTLGSSVITTMMVVTKEIILPRMCA